MRPTHPLIDPTVEHAVYRNWDDVVRLFSEYDHAHVPGRKTSHEDGQREDFFGSESYDQCVGWLTGTHNQPWPQANYQDHRLTLSERALSRPADLLSMAGHRPDIPLYLANDPEHMWDRDRGRQQPAITFLVDLGFPWYISAADLTKRAVSIAVTIESLEAQGIACEVWGYAAPDKDSKIGRRSWSFRCKSASQLLDLSRLRLMLSPAFFRRFIFSLIERDPVWDDARDRDVYGSWPENLPTPPSLAKVVLDGISYTAGQSTPTDPRKLLATIADAIEAATA